MKHLSYLLTLFLIGIFIASCQKEEQVLDAELPSIEDRGAMANAQRFKLDDYRGCYNDMMTQVKRKSFEEQFGEPAKVEIIYKNTHGYSTVYPLMTDRRVTTLLWVNGVNDGYFIPQNASLSKDEIAGTNITRGVSTIFKLSSAQLDPNGSVREIQNILGDNFLVSKKRNQIIIDEISEVSEKANNKDVALQSIKPMCDNAELADLYFIMFGFHDESGGFPDYVFPQSVMIEAINTFISSNGGYCICPLPCLLQSILNDRDDVPEDIKYQMNQTSILSTFNLGVNFPYEELNAEVLDVLVEVSCRGTIENACSGDEISITEIENELIIASSSGLPLNEAFFQQMENNDWVVLTKAFKDCSSLLCVYNTLKDNNNDLFCSTIDEGFISNPLSKLILDASHHVGSQVFYFDNNANGDGVEPNAATLPETGAKVTIVFNKDRCSDGYSSIEFVRTLLHEAIHAKMFSDCWPAGASYDDYREGFLACLEEHYFLELGSLPEDEQHIAMSNIFVEDIAQAINDYLGGNGSWEDYEYLAWKGLSQYPDYAGEQWFIDHLAEAKDRYENNTLPVSDPCGN